MKILKREKYLVHRNRRPEVTFSIFAASQFARNEKVGEKEVQETAD